MRVLVESLLPCRADLAWEEVLNRRLLYEVCAPVVTFLPVKGQTLPDRWSAGETIFIRSFLFGVIPLGIRSIVFDSIDAPARVIQSRESDPLVQKWDHRVSVTAMGDHQCRYRDEVEIDAGWLTPLVAWFARRLYHHRQRRWRVVAARLAAIPSQSRA